MGKLNRKAAHTDLRHRTDATTNFEGGLAFELDNKTRLYTRVVTSLFGENKFYQDAESHNRDLINDIYVVAQTDPEFVLKLAAYARNEMYLRTVPIVLLVHAAGIEECKPYVRKWTPHILRRADEPTEAVAYWLNVVSTKSKIPKQLRLGISDALNNFDEWQMEKYRDERSQVKTSDMLRIVHPEPKDDKQNKLYRYLRYGDMVWDMLPKITAKQAFLTKEEFDDEARRLVREGNIPWEVVVSKFGNNKEVWDSLELPFMAMLRNLRNILEAGSVQEQLAIRKLENPDVVLNSKQLPFRFFSAYRELQYVQGSDKLLDALSKAIEYSADNIPFLSGTTLIACDNSGSMSQLLSRRGSVRYEDVANLFGALAYRFCDKAIVGAFGTDWARVQLNPRDSVFTNMQRIANADTKGIATNGYRILQRMLEQNIRVDRIILLSDMQCYNSRVPFVYRNRSHAPAETQFVDLLQKYRSSINPNTILHSVDLAGYGTAQVPKEDPRTSLIAGWSDRIFQFIHLFEEDDSAVVKAIEDYRR